MRLGLAFAAPAPNLAFTRLAPASSPPAATVYGGCTDQNGDVLQLGGSNAGTSLAQFYKYTEPGGTPTWTSVTSTHTPWGLIGIAGVRDMLIRLDPVSGNVIALGATDSSGTAYSDTCSWNGTDWSDLGAGLGSIVAANDLAMDYDPATGHIMVVGGEPNGTYSNALARCILWSGSTWAAQSSQPTARAGAGLAMDPVRGIAVAFGGYNGPNTNPTQTVLGDTWTCRSGSTWASQSPATSPSARYYPQMYYDVNLRMVVLYGGNNNSITFTDAWGWNGSTWVKLNMDLVGAVKSGAIFVPSAKLAKTISFGGYPGGLTPFADTWQLVGRTAAGGINPVQYSAAMGTSSPLAFSFAPTA